jgi:NTE family protein
VTTTIHAELVRDKEAAKPRIGLVLSSDGARVFGHVGALRALNQLGVHPDSIVEVSMKAAVGATYALNDDWYDALIDMDISGFPLLPDFSAPGC